MPGNRSGSGEQVIEGVSGTGAQELEDPPAHRRGLGADHPARQRVQRPHPAPDRIGTAGACIELTATAVDHRLPGMRRPPATSSDRRQRITLARSAPTGDISGLKAEGRRAISVQLASGDQRPGRTSVVIVALAVALGLDVEVDRIRDPLIGAARLMLIDQRGAFAVVPIPVVRSLKSRTAVRRELVTGVPQIMNVTAAQLGAAAALAAVEADDGRKPENPPGLRTLPCSLRKRTPLPEPVKSAAHFLRKLPPVALDSLLQRGHQQPRARQEPKERR